MCLSSASTLCIQHFEPLPSVWLKDWHGVRSSSGCETATPSLDWLLSIREQGALLLDDTYNASPESTLAALNLLEELDGRKVAVLGDMLELGQYEEEGHELVGARAAESRIRVGHRWSARKNHREGCNELEIWAHAAFIHLIHALESD